MRCTSQRLDSRCKSLSDQMFEQSCPFFLRRQVKEILKKWRCIYRNTRWHTRRIIWHRLSDIASLWVCFTVQHIWNIPFCGGDKTKVQHPELCLSFSASYSSAYYTHCTYSMQWCSHMPVDVTSAPGDLSHVAILHLSNVSLYHELIKNLHWSVNQLLFHISSRKCPLLGCFYGNSKV